MSHSPSTYLHGTAPSEQNRLSRLNSFLNGACLRELNLNGGERILDVGCGLMQFSRAMARAARPDGAVVCVERDPEQVREGLRQAREAGEENLVDVRQGDVFDLPLEREEWGTFDVVHARFLLEHLADPSGAVAQMLRALRPGGRIVLADDDHELLRLWPPVPRFQTVWFVYQRTYSALGNDPAIGRRLVELISEAGARTMRNTFVFFGACAGHHLFESTITNLIEVVTGARESVLGSGLIDADSFNRGMDDLRKWSRGPHPALWYPMCWSEGVKPDVSEP